MTRKFFLIYTPGDQSPLALDLDTLRQTWSDRRVIDFAFAAQLGDARWVGPQLVIRICPWSLRKKKDGSCEVAGDTLVRSPTRT